MRDPKEIQEEVLKKKLKTIHPFKGDLVIVAVEQPTMVVIGM
jgi:hypothetical protein